MECPRCGETVDAGAAYCGNCGAALTAVAIAPSPALPSEPTTASLAPLPAPVPVPAPFAPTSGQLPAYAVANPAQHKAETKSMVALIVSVLSVPGAIVPIVGWILATVGIVMASINRPRMKRKLMNDFALGFGALSILLSSGVFVYSIQQQNKHSSQTAANRSSLITSSGTSTEGVISTPCYSVDVPQLKNIENASGSCKAQAFNADTLVASTDAFNIEAVTQADITEANLAQAGRQIADNYLRATIPDLVITSQASGSFAGSPAYIIAGKSKGNVTIELALVVRKVSHGENIFVLAHAINNAQADVSQFEAGWKWK